MINISSFQDKILLTSYRKLAKVLANINHIILCLYYYKKLIFNFFYFEFLSNNGYKLDQVK